MERRPTLTIRPMLGRFLLMVVLVVAALALGLFPEPSPDMKVEFYAGVVVCSVQAWALLEIVRHVLSRRRLNQRSGAAN